MDVKSKNTQLQFQGYLNTPLLWENDKVLDIKQLELTKQNTSSFDGTIVNSMLLGKRVERFVIKELQNYEAIKINLENAQIQNDKITIGEIDCLLTFEKKPIHLEIVYKFYVYDSRVGNTELEHWIGPNRKDDLLKKLHKLKDKQLPLLYNEHTKPILKELQLDTEEILQRVYFKAQLFIPYKTVVPDFKLLNKKSLKGFYIPFKEIGQFSESKFYIPIKVDWLLEVQMQVDWMSYLQFHERIEPKIANKTASLCWIKFPNGVLQKFFVTWWE